MNWLVKNRRGAQWNNTRDTAIALLALTDYLNVSHELAGGISYELAVNGERIATRTISAANALSVQAARNVDSFTAMMGIPALEGSVSRGA